MPDDSPELSLTGPDGTYVDRMTVVYRAIDSPSSNCALSRREFC
jgi:hypothetical protein